MSVLGHIVMIVGLLAFGRPLLKKAPVAAVKPSEDEPHDGPWKPRPEDAEYFKAG